jgi:hypothetical protein
LEEFARVELLAYVDFILIGESNAKFFCQTGERVRVVA